MSRNYILQLTDVDKEPELLKLEWYAKVSDIKNVDTNLTNLRMTLRIEPSATTKCFEVKTSKELNEILSLLNPI